MKISTSAARACKKLRAFVADTFSVNVPQVGCDAEAYVYTTGTPVTKYTGTSVNNSNKNISDDLAMAGSFSFIPLKEPVLSLSKGHAEPVEASQVPSLGFSKDHPEPVEGKVELTAALINPLKISVMKQILRCLQIVANFLTGCAHIFFNGFFKGGFLHRKNKSWKMKVLYVNTQYANTLPFNKHAMRNFLPVTNSNKFSFMKRILRKSGVFTIALLIANLSFISNTYSQTTITNGNTVNASAITAGNTITINAGGTLNMDVARTFSSITTANTGTSTISGGATLLTVTNAINLGAGNTLALNTNTNSASLIFLNNTTASIVNIGSGITLAVSGTVTIPRSSSSANSLNVGAGTLKAGSIAFTNGGGSQRHVLTISTGTVTVTGNIDCTGSGGSATITVTGTGIINVGGYFLTSAAGVGSDYGTFSAGTGTVNFNGITAQTIDNNTNGGFTNYNFNNLSVNNTSSSGATLAAAATATNVAGNINVGDVSIGSLLNTGNFAVAKGAADQITVYAGSTLNAGTSIISWGGAAGVITINGIFQTANTNGFSGSTTTAINSTTNAPNITLGSASTIQYNRAGTAPAGAQTVTNAQAYNGNLILSGTSVKTFAGATAIAGNLNIISTASAQLPTGTTSTAATLSFGGVQQVAGSWGSTNAGTPATNKNSTYFGTTTTGILNVGIATTTALTSSANPSVFGQSVTFTATVTPGGGGPTGTVTFMDGATTLGTGTLNGSGVATFSTSSLSVATHSITAVYGGDATYITSTSSALSQVVNKASSTTTVISSSVNPSVYGQSTTFTVTVGAVSPGSGTPTGTVQFKDGGVNIGSPVTLSGGSATLTTSAFNIGSNTVTAVYSGDANFTASTSGNFIQTVNQSSSTSTVTSSVNPSVFGQSVTLTATVSAVSPGTGTPTGTVTFKDGATTLGTGTLSSGSAAINISTLIAGTHNITIVYGGDADFSGSTSVVLAQVVNQATPTINVITASQTISYGTGFITLSGTVSAPGPLYPPNGETVSVTINGSTQSANISGGAGGFTVTFPTSAIPVSATPYTIKYSYLGDGANFAAAADNTSTTLTVNNPVPAISNITPVSVCQSSGAFTLTVNGSNFISSSVVNFNGSARTTTYISPNQVTAAILASDVLSSGNFNVTVTNPAPGGGTSSPVVFTVNATPTVTAPPNKSYCNGATAPAISLSGSPSGVVYDISGGSSIGLADQTGLTSVPSFTAITGSATVSITPRANGCTGTAVTYNVTVNPVLSAVTISPTAPQTICLTGVGSQLSVSETGGGTINARQWAIRRTSGSNTGIIIVSGATGTTFTPAGSNFPGPGTFYVICTSISSCGALASNEVVVTVPPNSAITSVTGGTSPLCIGGTTMVTPNGVVLGIGTGGWTSSSPAVASVDGSGNVKALSAGTTNIIYSITGGCGGDVSALQAIVVNEAPIFTNCPTNISVNNDAGQCSAVVTYTSTASGTPTPSLTYSFDGATTGSGSGTGSGSIFNKGVTTVSIAAHNSCSPDAICSFTITVLDSEAPVLGTIPGDITVNCDGIPAAATVTASDNCDPNPTITVNDVSTQAPSGTGQYNYTITRTWTATDVTGNHSSADQIITVQDVTAPVVTPPADATVSCDGSTDIAHNGTATAVDACDPSPVITSSDVSTQAPSGTGQYNYTITRTWTATDVTGNHSSADQIITVQDVTAPVVTPPADATVSCDGSTDIAHNGTATAVDACDPSPVITSSDVSTQAPSGTGQYNYTITRTWTATDVTGNHSSADQIITVQDVTAPVVTPPADATVSCDGSTDIAHNGTATAVDACDPSPVITSSDVSTQAPSGTGQYNYTITRTWTATDVTGNHSSADQIITVQDVTAPVVTPPADATVSCDGSTDIAHNGTATAVDACDPSPVITSSDVSTQAPSGTGQYNYTITRTWTATDVTGNHSSADQIITVQDVTAPVVTPPAGATVSCDGSTDIAHNGTATAVDACDPSPVITSSDVSTQAPSGTGQYNYTITRTWTATDVTGNHSSADQIITVQDVTAPVVTPPADATVSCDGSTDIAHNGTATAVDACDPSPVITSSDVSTQAPSGTGQYNYTITRTWTATDVTGNHSSADQIITVQDVTAPVVTPPADATVSCDGSTDIAHNGTATAVDACDPSPVITSSDVSTQAPSGTGQYNYTITRTWTATDVTGNHSSADQIITVQDVTAPVVTPPADATVSCDGSTDIAHNGTATAVDACDPSPVITSSDVSTQAPSGTGQYNYTITRTWTATDVTGNHSSADQIITVQDVTAPVVTPPADATVSCDGSTDIAHNGTATAVDACDPSPVITSSDVSTQAPSGTGQYNYTITRTWTATDVTGNHSSADQIITVQDVTAPVVTPPADATVSCDGSTDIAHNGTATAVDACDPSPVITSSDVSTQAPSGTGQYNYTITRTWTATDVTGNHSSADQIITVQDITAPVFMGCPANITSCEPVVNWIPPTALDNCSGAATITSNHSPGETFPIGTTTVIYTATDASNNSATCSFTITVNQHPTATITGSATICNGGTANLSLKVIGTGNFTGTLSDGTSFSGTAPSTISVSVMPTATTTYTVVALSDANCSAQISDFSGSALVTVLPTPTASITGTAIVCQNVTMPIITFTNPMALPLIITYTIYDGSNTTTSVINVNGGTTGTVTAPTTTPGTFTYAITSVQYQGGVNCQNAISGQSAVVTVYGNSTLSLTSFTQSASQSVCIDFPIDDITYAIGGGGTGAHISAGALPNGVSGSYAAGVFTITGTPTLVAPGTYNYTVTTDGSCGNQSLSGSITVGAEPTITALPSGSENQTVCMGTPISSINFAIGGSATGAQVGGLPSELTGSYNAGIFTISGTPTVSGIFPYTVITTGGPCTNITINGTITVNANSTISLSSSAQSAAQTICFGSAIAPITYAIDGGSTGATVTGLPPNVTYTFNAGLLTISGTPSLTGTYQYIVKTTGSCANPSDTGTININTQSTISLTSTGTDIQSVCINNAITYITYAIGGGATNAAVTSGALPNGVSGTYDATLGVFTIKGTPTVSGPFNFIVTAMGPCNDVSAAQGTITVNPSPLVNLINNVAYCNGDQGSAISFSSPNSGVTYNWTSTADVGFGLAGSAIGTFTATNNTNSPITATVSVTATGNNCVGTATTFTVTVNPTAAVNAISNLNYCAGLNGGPINFSSPTTGTITYNWSSDNNVGFGLNGTGSIPAFTATNNSINPVTATVTVTPSINGCGGTPKTFTITVTPNAAGTITGYVSPLCPPNSPNNTPSAVQLATTGVSNGTSTWTSSNPTIATVSSSGLVTAVTGGTTQITYSVTTACGTSVSAPITVMVNTAANAGTISAPAASVCTGSSIQLITNGTPGGYWLSLTPTVATVDVSSGIATGVTAGPAQFIYYVTTACGTATSAPFTLTVNAGTGSAGTIIGTSPVCPNGSIINLVTTGSPGGTWVSSNPLVANLLVAYNGGAIFMSGNAGTTTITYSIPAGTCGLGSVSSFALTVNPTGNVGNLGGPTTVCANATILLSTTLPPGGTWSSGTPSVASVNQSGIVTGVGQGNAYIYYSVPNSCGGAIQSLNVTVNPAVTAGTLTGPSAVCTNAKINLITSGTPGGNWTSSDQTVAVVDGSGVVKGISAGTVTITYQVSSTCATVTSTYATIIVNPLPNAGTVRDKTVCKGASITFASFGGDTGGTWSSSDPTVASVNSASGVVTGVAAGNATITYTVTSSNSCGTSAASGNITVNPILNAGTINGGPAVCMGSTLNLSSSGNTGGSWTSSNQGVATIDALSGVVTPVSPGTTTITYNLASNGCGAASASQLITVNPLANAGALNNVTVCAGSSTTFMNTGGMSGGSWSSSNTAVATVDAATGVVTGVAAGSATISYSVTTSCGTSAPALGAVTVNPLANAGTISGPSSVCVNHTISLTSTTTGGTWSSSAPLIATVSGGVVTGKVGGTATISYTVTTPCGTDVTYYSITVNSAPNAGSIAPAAGTPSSLCPGTTFYMVNTGGMTGGTWLSSTPSTATVDAVTGEVNCVSAGTAIIFYSVSNGCGGSTASVMITVSSLPNAGTISGPNSVCGLSTINLSSNGNAGGMWTSNNTLVATVDPMTGVVTGKAQGTATIIYTVGSPMICGTAAATYDITVYPPANAGTINGVLAVCKGLSTSLASTGSTGGTWNSSNTSVATVDALSGVVTGVGAGIATITYTVSTPTCGSQTASASVTVNPLPVAGPISGPSNVCANATITLSATNNLGVYNNGGTGTAKWSSNSNAIATVGPNTGIVTGVAAGTVTITYTVTTDCGASTSTYQVSVNPLPSAGTLSGSFFVCTGSTTSLTSSVTGGTWISSNTSAATVDPATGVVSGVAAGSSIITYTVTSASGCGTDSKQVTVTVGDLPNAGTVTGAATLCAGSTAIFTSDGTGGGTWTSNSAAATVDAETGVVTGVHAGSATITYTVSGTCGSSSKSANITINALPNPGTVSGIAAICSGSTATFSSNGASGGSWSSNNSPVATVDANGLVTAHGPGSADITYSVTNSCGTVTASATVTVNALPNAGTVSGAATLCAGSTTIFTSNGSGGGTWSSDDPTVAAVDPVTGVVHGQGQGSTLIKYTVTSTNCGSAVSSASITVSALPNAGITNNSLTTILTCATQSISVTATGGGTYSWSGGLGNAANATITSPGLYTVSVTSAGGCTSTATISISQDINAPTVGITNNSGTTVLTCATQSISVTATGGGTYAWSAGLGNAASATINAPGTYTVTVTSGNGCTSTASIIITQNITPPTAAITNNTGTTVLTCNTTSISVTATGGGTYSWSDGLGNAAAATINSPGTYTVTVTSANGCSSTASIMITQNNTPPGTPVVGTITQPACGMPTGSVVLSGLPSTGTWTLTRTPGGTTTGTGTTATITGLPANTTYHFTVTNSVGCISGVSGDVAISAAPALPSSPSVGTITQPNCSVPTGSVTLNGLPTTGSGTWTLTRMPGSVIIAGSGSSKTITGLAPNTTYTFTVTNSNGCTSLQSANVVMNAASIPPTVSASNITASTDPNSCSASVSLGANVTLTGPGVTLQYRIGYFWWFSYPIPSTYTFSRGTTPVIVIATNSCGTAYAIFNVTVVDNTPPTINCLPNATRTINGNSSRYSVHGHEFDVTATDGCGIASLVYSLSGATSDGFDNDNRSLNNVRFNVGTTTVTWRATDVNGNVSTCSFTVTVTQSGHSSANPPAVPGQSNAKVDMFAAGLTVTVAPNPTSNYFTLSLNSIGTEKIKINVVDVLGRPIEKITDITPNSTVQIGGKYHPGIYMVQAIQGQQTVVLKLIKEGN